jgi:ActR/RegA family two-component response regulator
MRQKIVLVVEDDLGLRTTYTSELAARGFDVYSAGTVKEARYLISELGEKIDVALLDMKLELDPDEPATTGADLGLELKRKCVNITPEFLIRSGYNEVVYLKSALDLGAAAYLSKKDTYLDDVIRHVRALMLRHYLKVENPNVIEELNRIAATTKNISDSIRSFCEHILAPAFADCLGAPFMLLLTDEIGTQNCAGSAPMPLTFEKIYHTLQAMIHANADPVVPYSFEERHVWAESGGVQQDFMIEQLQGSAFVSLASVNKYRLSLGILKAPKEEEFPEGPLKLASVVSRYVRSTICENFIKILVQIDTKRKTTLGSTSQLCLFLGQDQLTILDQGVSLGDLSTDSSTHLRLQAMAEDLEETGVILMNVATSLDATEMTRVQMTPLIKETWDDLSDTWMLKDIKFELKGECSVVADQDDLYIIIARVLQWLAQRKIATEPPFEPTITVSCESDNRTARLIFEDRSRRLLPSLRERLFEPFTLAVPSARSLTAPRRPTEAEISDEEIKVFGRRPGYLPLYLAKTLVEEKYRGWFEDKSDEMEGDVGHRLVMQLHKAFEPQIQKAGV